MDEDNTPDPATADVPMLGFDADDEWNRPRGLYTGTDRQFLWGVKSYDDSPVARSNRRKEVRERTVNGLRDLLYLTLIEDDQREKIVAELAEETEPGELRDAVSSLVEFLYVGLDDSEAWLEETVTDGVSNALHAETGPDTHGYPSVDVDIETERGRDLDALERRLHGRAHTLTDAEIGALVRSGRVTGEEVEDLRHDADENPALGTSVPFPEDG